MSEPDLIQLTLSDAVSLIERGELSPHRLTEAYLARIERLNPVLNAFLTVMGESALRQARYASEALRRGERWGVLHGIPIGVKDLIDVAGVQTTAGSDFLRGNVALEDAYVVQQLKAAGAIIIGKTHLHEFAVGATNVNPHYGPARNPWNTDYSPGGSSGGSAAAVAASLCAGALGTDTGGSVRVPSALCNLTGLRPRAGRLNLQGVIPMSWTLDTVGPMAHTARDVALLMDALDPQPVGKNGYTAQLDQPVGGLRVGLPVDDFFWLETDIQVVAAVRTAVERLAEVGMRPVEVSLPMSEEVPRAAGVISLSEAAAYHRERLSTGPERFGEDVRTRLEWGAQRSAVEYVLAQRTMHRWRTFLKELFGQTVDILALPTTPLPAHPIEGSEGIAAAKTLLRFTYPFSLSGLPALSLPCGFTDDGFPIGLQLVAPEERRLLQAAHAYQGITRWHLRRPIL